MVAEDSVVAAVEVEEVMEVEVAVDMVVVVRAGE